MSRRLFTVRDMPGFYVYVGQCYYVDEATGENVEHDWMRLAPLEGEGDTLWVAPEDALELVDDVLASMVVAS